MPIIDDPAAPPQQQQQHQTPPPPPRLDMTTTAKPPSLLSKVAGGFRSLKDCSPELWAINIVKILESFNYFSLSITAADYLTGEFGVPDVTAGSIYGAWGMLIVLYGVLGGAAIDAVGVRGCLLFSAATTGAARALLAVTRSKGLALFCFFVPAAVGGALGVPVLTIGVKRCAPPHARGFAFSLFYVAMNLAALVAGLLRDVFLVHVPLTPKEKPPPGLRAYMGLGAAAAALQILVVVFFVKSGKWQEEEEEEEGGSAAASASTTTTTGVVPASASASAAAVTGEGSVGSVSGVNLLPRGGTRSSASFDGVSVVSNDGGAAAAPPETAVAPANDDDDDSASVSKQQQHHHRRRGRRFSSSSFFSLSALSSLARSSWLAATSTLRAVAGPELYKFVAMSVLTVNLKSIFRHLDATLPKFVARAFGCSAPAGSIYSINPAMIMTLVPLVGAALSWLEPFDAIHYGGYVSAASPLAIVAAPTLGGTAGFVALLSVGEAVWSPRWYDYSMSVAPNGREGLFTALASAPLFLAKLPTGALSGALLQRFCAGNGPCPSTKKRKPGEVPGPPPPPGNCDGRALWGVISAITFTTPFAILLLQRWLRPRPALSASAAASPRAIVVVSSGEGENGVGVADGRDGGERNASSPGAVVSAGYQRMRSLDGVAPAPAPPPGPRR